MPRDPRPFRLAVNARWLLPGALEGTGWYSHRLLERLCTTPSWEVHLFFDRDVEDFDGFANHFRARAVAADNCKVVAFHDKSFPAPFAVRL